MFRAVPSRTVAASAVSQICCLIKGETMKYNTSQSFARNPEALRTDQYGKR